MIAEIYPSRSGFRQQVVMNWWPCYLEGRDEVLLPLPRSREAKGRHRHDPQCATGSLDTRASRACTGKTLDVAILA